MDAHVIRSDNGEESATNAVVISSSNGKESVPNEIALFICENNQDVALLDCHQDDELEEEVEDRLLALGSLKRPSSRSSDVWKYIKLLYNMDICRPEKDYKHYCTHYCSHCSHCVSLPSNE